MALIKIDGSEFELDDAICKTDKSLKDALGPFYPAAANADIKRETKGDRTVITVTKRAGSKGNYDAVLRALDEAPESISPALVLMTGGGTRGETGKTLDEVLLQTLDDERDTARVREVLDSAVAEAAGTLPVGF